MQRRLRLKPIAITIIYWVVCITLVIGLMTLGIQLLKTDMPVTYITSSTITEDIKPVISEKKVFQKPYHDEEVKILQNFYDKDEEKDIQEKSLILFENTYLQNSGVDYGKSKEFDVVSIYSGKVIDILEDEYLGKTIKIAHSNNLIASYQCLGTIKVNKDDTVIEGQVIANSGTCNISKELGNHLHLEVSNEGKMINPESIYNKSVDEV